MGPNSRYPAFEVSRDDCILLCAWHGYHRSCVDLVSVAPSQDGWKDLVSVLLTVEQGKRDMHAFCLSLIILRLCPVIFFAFGS